MKSFGNGARGRRCGKLRLEASSPSDDTLISLAWLEAAKAREPEDDEYQERDMVAGIDVAGPGKDETVCYLRRRDSIVDFAAWSSPDPRGRCVAFLMPYKGRVRSVNVDSIGIGYNFAQHLQDQGFHVNFVNVSESAVDAGRYANLKAEYYWQLRERLEAGELAGLTDDHTISQLGTIRWETDPAGQDRHRIEGGDAQPWRQKSRSRRGTHARVWRSPLFRFLAPAIGAGLRARTR